MKLHGFFRSGASWRVRIVLGLKGITADSVSYQLRENEQRAPAFLRLNPQGLVPALELDDGRVLTQSLAIIDYLDALYPDPPLLPADPFDAAFVRSLALVVAADIHPIQNLKILERIKVLAGEEASVAWARDIITEGLEALEAMLSRTDGPFCFGSAPTLADVCLLPQLGNARRFGVDAALPRIHAIEQACLALPAFADAVPEKQADAS